MYCSAKGAYVRAELGMSVVFAWLGDHFIGVAKGTFVGADKSVFVAQDVVVMPQMHQYTDYLK